jgi:DNA-binding NarL/FixJ family response regulator
MKEIDIILVEDHTVFREVLAEALSRDQEFKIVAHYGDAEEALQALPGIRFDVAIIDTFLPGMDGKDLTRKIIEDFPHSKVIILSADNREKSVFEAFAAGAMGYLPKTVSLSHLGCAIKSGSRGDAVIDNELTKNLFRQCAQPTASKTEEEMILSPQEKEILALAKDGHSNKEIAGRMALSVSTIKFRFREICHKLKVKDRVQSIVKGIRLGLIKADDSDASGPLCIKDPLGDE